MLGSPKDLSQFDPTAFVDVAYQTTVAAAHSQRSAHVTNLYTGETACWGRWPGSPQGREETQNVGALILVYF